MYAHEQVDMTPLSEAEKRELRARLNARGREPLGLEPREYDAWIAMTAIRSPEAIGELIAKVRADLRGPNAGSAYLQGVLHAVAWATGEVREGPITGRIPEGRLPTVREMEREEDAAVRVLRWQQECVHPRHHVSGVEACLMWLRGAGYDSPC